MRIDVRHQVSIFIGSSTCEWSLTGPVDPLSPSNTLSLEYPFDMNLVQLLHGPVVLISVSHLMCIVLSTAKHAKRGRVVLIWMINYMLLDREIEGYLKT